jgi:hypothetical protein
LLVVSLPLCVAIQGAGLGTSDSSTLNKGDYAVYSASSMTFYNLVGYRPRQIGLAQMWPLSQLNNSEEVKTDITSLRLSWRIADVSDTTYLVKYNLNLIGVNKSAGNDLSLMSDVIVSRTNNTAYAANGTELGTWPYWLAPSSRVLFGNVTMVHGFPWWWHNLTGVKELRLESTPCYISLPLGNGIAPNDTVASKPPFFDSTFDLPAFGTFKTDRLLVTYPTLKVYYTGSQVNWETPALQWVALFDRFSGTMLALDLVDWYSDDIMLHSQLAIWMFTLKANALVLTSTSLNLSPDIPSTSPPPDTGIPPDGGANQTVPLNNQTLPTNNQTVPGNNQTSPSGNSTSETTPSTSTSQSTSSANQQVTSAGSSQGFAVTGYVPPISIVIAASTVVGLFIERRRREGS